MARPQQKGPQQYKRRPRPRRFPQKAKKQLQEQKLSPENDSSSVISDGTEAEADYKTLDIKLENTTVETNEVLMISGGEWLEVADLFWANRQNRENYVVYIQCVNRMGQHHFEKAVVIPSNKFE